MIMYGMTYVFCLLCFSPSLSLFSEGEGGLQMMYSMKKEKLLSKRNIRNSGERQN